MCYAASWIELNCLICNLDRKLGFLILAFIRKIENLEVECKRQKYQRIKLIGATD